MLIWAGINFNALAASILLLPNESNQKNISENETKENSEFQAEGNEGIDFTSSTIFVIQFDSYSGHTWLM